MFLGRLFTKKDQESGLARRKDELDRLLSIAACNASWDEAEALVRQGAASGTSHGGHTALFNAARGNRVDLVKALAPSATWPKKDPDAPNPLYEWSDFENDNQNPLMAACANGSLDAARILLASAPPETLLERDVHGASCLDFAVFSGNVDLVQELLGASFGGQIFGHHDRWQAAAVAAALNNSNMLDFFEKNPASPFAEGNENSGESLAVCALAQTCSVFSEHGSAHFRKKSAYIDGIDDWDIYEPALNIAIDRTLVAFGGPDVAAVAQALRMDCAKNAPPREEDWPAKAFSAAVRARCEDACHSLLAATPELASASIDGFSALMLASSAGLLSVCQALAPMSNCSAQDESGESALSLSLWGISSSKGYESDPKAEVFSFLASLADEAQWLREEDALWRTLACDQWRHWPDDEVLMAARSAAKRSSPAALSKALAMAIAEDKPLLVELLYPMTNSANNASAVLAEFVRRCSRNPAMAALVATAASTLTDVEALTAASPEPAALVKAPSKRL